MRCEGCWRLRCNTDAERASRDRMLLDLQLLAPRKLLHAPSMLHPCCVVKGRARWHSLHANHRSRHPQRGAYDVIELEAKRFQVPF